MTDLIPASDLASLAEQINLEHVAVGQSLTEGLEHARRAGELLLKAKALVSHGDWLPWLAANCTASERSAQGYMRIARRYSELAEGNPQRVADLSLREGLKLLTEPTEQSAEKSYQDPLKHLLNKPDSPYIPKPGFRLIGRRDGLSLFVHPSEHEGFFHLARWDDEADGGRVSEGTKKPMPSDLIEWGLDGLHVHDFRTLDWFSELAERTAYNPYLYTSKDDEREKEHAYWRVPFQTKLDEIDKRRSLCPECRG